MLNDAGNLRLKPSHLLISTSPVNLGPPCPATAVKEFFFRGRCQMDNGTQATRSLNMVNDWGEMRNRASSNVDE